MPKATGRRTSGSAARRSGAASSSTRPPSPCCWPLRWPIARALDGVEVATMVRRALGFIARNGPATEQDRWEEDAGHQCLHAGGRACRRWSAARRISRSRRARFALDLADYWNARIEDWTSVRDTALARAAGVAGYYVRIAPPPDLAGRQRPDAHSPDQEPGVRPRPSRGRTGGDRLPAARALRPARSA